MLVLTRKRFEKIQIGEDIIIKVIKTGRSTVKIGIEAPEDVRVMRAELCHDQKPGPRATDIDFSELGELPALMACSDQFPHAV